MFLKKNFNSILWIILNSILFYTLIYSFNWNIFPVDFFSSYSIVILLTFLIISPFYFFFNTFKNSTYNYYSVTVVKYIFILSFLIWVITGYSYILLSPSFSLVLLINSYLKKKNSDHYQFLYHFLPFFIWLAIINETKNFNVSFLCLSNYILYSIFFILIFKNKLFELKNKNIFLIIIKYIKKNILSFILFAFSLTIFYLVNYIYISYIITSNFWAIMLLSFSRILFSLILRFLEISLNLLKMDTLILSIFLIFGAFVVFEFFINESLGISANDFHLGNAYYLFLNVIVCSIINLYSIKMKKIF